MKSKRDKGTPCKVRMFDGAEVSALRTDDGVTVRHTLKYEDWARASIDMHEAHGRPTGSQTGPDPLEVAMAAAKAMLAYVADNPDTLAEGDVNHKDRLRAELGNLRDVLRGEHNDNPKYLITVGVAFGKALEQMRVRLDASAVSKQRALVARNRKNSTKAAEESAKQRNRAAFYKEVQSLYANRTNKESPKSTFIQHLINNHGSYLEHKYPGCGLSESTLYEVLKAL